MNPAYAHKLKIEIQHCTVHKGRYWRETGWNEHSWQQFFQDDGIAIDDREGDDYKPPRPMFGIGAGRS